MEEIGMLDNTSGKGLTLKQIDNIVFTCIDVGTILYQPKNDLYVPPKMRNDLSDSAWEYKMETLGKVIQEHMN